MQLLTSLLARARSRSSGGFQSGYVPKHLPKAVAVLAGATAAYQAWSAFPAAAACQQVASDAQQEDDNEFANWSATHKVRPRQLFEPESVKDLQRVVAQCHASGQKIRVVGSGLSPNGMAFSPDGMLSTALLDQIISVDPQKQQVTVQAGARVQQVVEALQPHGLTLQNFASIREQTMGGFTQEQDPELFHLARVRLGCLGVVAELTLQCVPSHQLLQHTQVMTRKQVHEQHKQLLQSHRHLRYMWLPYTDAVVVVTCKAYEEGEEMPAAPAPAAPGHQLAPFRELLHSLCGKVRQGVSPDQDLPSETMENVDRMSGTELRDHLLAIDPLDHLWVAGVNQVKNDCSEVKDAVEKKK